MATLGEALLRGDAMSRTEVEALLLRLASEHRPGAFEEKDPSTQRQGRTSAAGSKSSTKKQSPATIKPVKPRQGVKKTTTNPTAGYRQRLGDAAAGEAVQRGSATRRPAGWEVLREGTQTLCDCAHHDTHVFVPTSPTASYSRPSTTDHRGLHAAPPPSERVYGLAATSSSSTQSRPLRWVDLILM